MEPDWNYEPTPWERIASFGVGFWMLFAAVGIAGIIVARHILTPSAAAYETSRAQGLARSRTLSGFAFVASLSIGYRSFTDTLDSALWNFEKSVPVALTVFSTFVLIFWLGGSGATGDQIRSELPVIWRRIVTFAVVIGGTWMPLLFLPVGSPLKSRGQAELELLVVSALVGLIGMGFWCISCHWFGIGQVHPFLPPLVAATTILIVTGLELHYGDPSPLPLRLWLMINFSALITTLGVCFVEICDARTAAYCVERQWPLVTAAAFVILALTGAVLLLATGGPERILCAERPDLVSCGMQVNSLAGN